MGTQKEHVRKLDHLDSDIQRHYGSLAQIPNPPWQFADDLFLAACQRLDYLLANFGIHPVDRSEREYILNWLSYLNDAFKHVQADYEKICDGLNVAEAKGTTSTAEFKEIQQSLNDMSFKVLQLTI